ncbi:hypothetical protein IMZ68_06595 [Candidatus Bathyarchaeota archaeon]|nr:hypothetical protein [Candidatus Bathyarchaeota archaeon]
MEQVEQQVPEVVPEQVPPEQTTQQEPPVIGTTEGAEQVQVNPDDQYIFKMVVDGNEEVLDIRNADQRKKLEENARQGIKFTKKMQSVAEWEKANQAQTQFNSMIMADPDILKISVAKQNGLDPSSLYGELKPPDPNLANVDPALYNQLAFEYQTRAWQRNQIETMTQAYGKMQSEMNNTALFERARIEHDLNDVEFNQVKTFLAMNVRPNNFGMFSREQMDFATSAIVGKSRQAQQQMNTIKKIDQSIKSAAQPMNSSAKTRSVASSQKETEKFHDFVREHREATERR